jgi:hypothetical protein
MTPLKKGLMVGVLQVLLIGSVGAKFLLDREQYPRVWIQTRPVDPNLPIRGRYVQLLAVVELEDKTPPGGNSGWKQVRLTIRDGTLVAIADASGHQNIRGTSCGAQRCWVLDEPVAFFIPEHAADPSRSKPGEELWVEASIPPKGPPRPIQLGVKVDGKLSVIDVH